MARVVSQETFDQVVRENVDDLDMDLEEAAEDAIQQFKAQVRRQLSDRQPNTSGFRNQEFLCNPPFCHKCCIFSPGKKGKKHVTNCLFLTLFRVSVLARSQFFSVVSPTQKLISHEFLFLSVKNESVSFDINLMMILFLVFCS